MTKVLVCVLGLLTCLSSATSAPANEFTPLIGFDQQLFPSFIISTATMKPAPIAEEDGATKDPAAVITLGDRKGLLGIQMKSPGKNTSVKVTISCDDVMEDSTFVGKFPEKGLEYAIYPTVRYRYTKLAEVTQATPVSMTFKVQVGSSRATEQTATVMLRPINDCPYLVIEGDTLLNTSLTFAAYVNEQHPYLDKLLREALDIGVVDSYTGYQSGSEQEVIRQVYSIWDALVTRDVRYSNITATSGEAQSVFSQHVRLLDQSLNNSQANCVDGAVLIASALRKIGIEPILVLIPGHCYLGFYLDDKREKLFGLETTLLGKWYEEGEEYDTLEGLAEAVTEDYQDEYSWPSFCSAIAAGTKSLNEHGEKFADKSESRYMLIDISMARRLGILPIAYRGKEKFVSNGLADADTDEMEAEEGESDEESEEMTDEESADESEDDSEEDDSDDEESDEDEETSADEDDASEDEDEDEE